MGRNVINTTINIDCFKGFNKLKDNSVDHVFTSPPYNRKRNDKYSDYDDTIKDYKTFLVKVINNSLRVSNGYVFFNIQKNYYNKDDVYFIIGKFRKYLIDIVIWNKSNPMPASGYNLTNAYEFILILSKNKTSIKSNKTYTKNHFETNAFTNNKYTKVHKAVMHPKACSFIIKHFTKQNELILDPFMGVGTTAITCIKGDRRFIGFELSEKYCKIANKRCDKFGKNK